MLWLTCVGNMRSVSVGRVKFYPLTDPACGIGAFDPVTQSYAPLSGGLQANAVALAIAASM